MVLMVYLSSSKEVHFERGEIGFGLVISRCPWSPARKVKARFKEQDRERFRP
jgi:hypothetical protein